MTTIQTTSAALLASKRFTRAQLAQGRKEAQHARGAHTLGFTPGGARVDILARWVVGPPSRAFYPVPGAGRWTYTYQIAGYAADGADLALA